MKRAIIFAIIMASGASEAGINATTVHSRANCFGFNESITWWLGNAYNWKVVSIHDSHDSRLGYHVIDTGYQVTWRQAAYHPHEAWAKWGYTVSGFHFLAGWGGGRYFADTFADDCGLENGWWAYPPYPVKS